MDTDDSTEIILQRFYGIEHHVWETAIWCNVAHKKLEKTKEGWRINSASELNKKSETINEAMMPCKVSVQPNGYYTYSVTQLPTNFYFYKRDNPLLYEEAMNIAFPEYFKSIIIKKR
jgi:hypothetical protein